MFNKWISRAPKSIAWGAVLVLSLTLATAGRAGATEGSKNPAAASAKMELTSEAFQNGQRISNQYTVNGPDISPPLHWSGLPARASSLALICDDPDAPMGTWVHWVIYNIPASEHELKAGVVTQENLPDGARQGKNSFGKIGYSGPSPPPGKPHRYFFKLYALDSKLNLPSGVKKDALLDAIKNHVLAETQLMGTYQHITLSE